MRTQSVVSRLRAWRQRRREEQARVDAVWAELRREYDERAAAGDPAVREAGRDYADNDGVPWRAQVLLAGGMLAFFVSVVLLVLFFSGVQALVDR